MPLLQRTTLALSAAAVGLLLSLAPRAAALPQPEPPVPMRSLAAELAQVEQGTAVYIHTHYGTGMGVLLSSQEGVVTARHNILTPSGSFADDIAVGIAQMPLHNIIEVRVLAAAQDPTQDLVLLRPVQGLFPPAEQQPESTPPAPPTSAPPPETQDRPPSGPVRVKERAAPQKRAKPHARPVRTARKQKAKAVAHPADLHVVWDGPSAQGKTAPGARHDVAVKRRVVEDGPLHPR